MATSLLGILVIEQTPSRYQAISAQGTKTDLLSLTRLTMGAISKIIIFPIVKRFWPSKIESVPWCNIKNVNKKNKQRAPPDSLLVSINTNGVSSGSSK